MIDRSPFIHIDVDRTEPAALDVYFLGCVDFDAAQFLQQTFADELAYRGDRHGKLLICEHPPLISIGREGGHANLGYSDAWLTEDHDDSNGPPSLDVRWVKRGGGAIVHAPGQLAIYPILPLELRSCGLLEYREKLQRAVMLACRDFRIGAETRDDIPGIFTKYGQVGFVGLSVSRGISRQGIFLNVSSPLDLHRAVKWSTMKVDHADHVVDLVACDDLGDDVTIEISQTYSANPRSANIEQSRRVAIPSLRERIMHHVQHELGYERSHLYTSHPLLRRVRRTKHVYA
ncbi:MAG: lipoyl protein ligase domain-containing protein [Planctomycetaceae bacterium]